VFYWTFDVGGPHRGFRFTCGFMSLHPVKVEQKVAHKQHKSKFQADLRR
jgi:hypothetical protein